MGSLGRALQPDTHVEDHPSLVGLPTIYHWPLLLEGVYPGVQLVSGYPGPHDMYVPGGTHLTASSLLTEAILKELTASEGSFYRGYINTRYLLSLGLRELGKEQEKLHSFQGRNCWLDSTIPLDQVDCWRLMEGMAQCGQCRYITVYIRRQPTWWPRSTFPGSSHAIPTGSLTGLAGEALPLLLLLFVRADPRNLDLLQAFPHIEHSVRMEPWL